MAKKKKIKAAARQMNLSEHTLDINIRRSN